MKIGKNSISNIFFLSLVVGILLFSVVAYAQSTPQGPDVITSGTPERRGKGIAADTIAAQAGNVTQLTVEDNRTTTVWQGYYGNVTSRISLTNSVNQTFYEWEAVNPAGEVFASNGSVSDWTVIRCVNFTNNGSGPGGQEEYVENLTRLEDYFNITSSQGDGIDETFNSTYSGSGFSVAGVSISSSDNCPQAYSNVNGRYQGASFAEVMLTDNNSIVFTSLLESSGATGFDGGAYHFQMLVAEDGRVAGGTTYYFYVEIT